MTFIMPGEKAPLKDPYANADRAYEEAREARKRNRERDKQLAWEKAVISMSRWTVSSAVESLTGMPQGLQQQYLLAEETGLNREEVLRFFPAVAPSTREAWSAFATPAAEPEKAPAKPRQRKVTSK